ncbi:MAG: hypothetical protein HY828_19450 [Actinobacteria bacterium]|nr:hypothetical protein [Actinomycetota bacterium]
MAGWLFHFSEDPTIERFVPHVPATNPTEPPAVWAIDHEHAPLYWFPRDCPRVAVWPWPGRDTTPFRDAWGVSGRVQFVGRDWLERMRTTMLFRYSFDAERFERWPAASGYWVCRTTVEPIRVEPMGDLVHVHEALGIDLRVVDDLWPVIDAAMSDEWDFSIVRKANAGPRR